MSEKIKLNMSKKQVITPKLDPGERVKNYHEVDLGYTQDMAIEESSRCLQCKHKPCVSGCPVHIDIPQFIKCIKENRTDDAHMILLKSSALPAVCGRVCPQEKQCQLKCVRGLNGDSVAIGKLERYAADNGKKVSFITKKLKNSCKTAVIGSGPSGITCARELALMGYEVTIFEALHTLGGVLSYGIPRFRLPENVLNNEVNNLISLGVKICTNTIIGRTFTIDELLNKLGYKAVYISTGAGIPKFMGIPGEKLPGVYSANEFLTRINLMHADMEGYDTPIVKPKHTIVVGGGNVAMDVARCAVRLGSDVTVVYRKTEEDMPARKEEVHHAKEEGINFSFLSKPKRIIGKNGLLVGMECVKTEYINIDSQNKKLVEAGSETFYINADCVIISIGNLPNSVIKGDSKEIEFDSLGRIVTNKETMRTSKSRVYAGGDIVTGSATVILAMEAGKKAAFSIDNDLKSSGDALI